MTAVTVTVKRLPHGADLPLPQYATAGSAGLDLLAAITDPMTLAPSERALVPTGLAIALPHGYEAQVRPRSGLALKNGVTVLNSPGTVDADYRGEIGVILANCGGRTVCGHARACGLRRWLLRRLRRSNGRKQRNCRIPRGVPADMDRQVRGKTESDVASDEETYLCHRCGC